MVENPGLAKTDLVRSRIGRTAFAVLLFVVVWLIYGQTASFEFVAYDTRDIVLHPRVQSAPSLENLWWLLTHRIIYNWTPLAWYSHILDHQLFGPSPGAHHLSNFAYHLAASLLLLVCLRGLTGSFWRSAIVALFFAVHPMRVESVAWVVERKDLLSAALGFAALWSYARYARRSSPVWYALCLLLFALSLLAKSILVTFPFLLLLVDHWPLHRVFAEQTAGQSGRETPSKLLLEKLPFFALSAAVSYITIFGVEYPDDSNKLLTFTERLANAVWSYGQYIRKLFVPSDLSLLYAHPYIGLTGGRGLQLVPLAVTSLALVGLTALCLWQLRRRGYLFVGWLWFLGSLVPVIGLGYQAGLQGMADRFSYLPSVGILIMVVWSAGDWVARLDYPSSRKAAIVTTVTSVFVVQLALIAHQYARYWSDSITLYRYVVERNPLNARVHGFLGRQLLHRGRTAEGIHHLEQAAILSPAAEDISTDLGTLLARMGRHRDAVRWFRQSMRAAPHLNHTRINLAAALAASGEEESAAELLEEALVRNPRSFTAVFNLAGLRIRQGRTEEALQGFARAASLRPDDPNVWLKWGGLLARLDRPERAKEKLQRVLQLDPGNAAAAELLLRLY